MEKLSLDILLQIKTSISQDVQRWRNGFLLFQIKLKHPNRTIPQVFSIKPSHPRVSNPSLALWADLTCPRALGSFKICHNLVVLFEEFAGALLCSVHSITGTSVSREKTQNYGIVKAGKDLQDHKVQPLTTSH